MIEENLAIATYDLTKQYDRHSAVTNVELQVKAGEVYGLIGPNGAGKTTLIRMLATAEQPTVGDIFLFGNRLQYDGCDGPVKQRLGYLPDDYPLYDDLSVWEYLDYFARLYHLSNPRRRQRLGEVLELVQLTSKRHSPIATLSRGMKQRLSLARTIVHEPLLLFLDEPVSGLDPIARSQFREIVKTLQLAGMTLLISSHVLSDLAELCTSIGIMELGYLVESASLQDLYQRLAQQRITIQTLGSLDALVSELSQFPNLEGWEIQSDRQSVLVSCSGNADASAELLRSLVLAGIPVHQFHCHQEDLESVFLKLGHQQVS